MKMKKHRQHVALHAESDFKSNACGALRQTINFVWPYSFLPTIIQDKLVVSTPQSPTS